MSFLGLLSAGLGVAGTAGQALSPWLDLYSQHQTNKTNREINQMNNQFNASEAQKVRDYNTMMWNENNRYNDPSAQVERLRKAGINPAFALGQVASGMASSQPNGGSPASSSGNAHMEALQFGSSFAKQREMENQKLITDAQVRNIDADTAGKVLDNRTKYELNIAKINDLINSAKTKGHQAEYEKVKAEMSRDMMNADKKRIDAETNVLNSQSRINTADAVIRELDATNYPERFKLELSERLANLAESYSRKDLNESQSVNAIAQVIESTARHEGIKLQNEITEEAKQDIIDSYKFSDNKSYIDSGSNIFSDLVTTIIGIYLLKGKAVKIKGFGR